VIKYGIGVALVLAAVAGPGSVSAASPVRVTGTAHQAARGAAGSAPVAWVVNQSLHSATKGSVTPINTATNTAGKNIKTGSEPLAIAIPPNGKTAYVLNLGQGEPGKGTVTPINTATNAAGTPIPLKDARFPDASNLMVMTPNGKTLYVADNTTLTPIDTATHTTLPAIRVAPRHGSDYGAAITPDGRTVYVEGTFDKSTRGFIVPVSITTGVVGKAIVLRGFPSSMAITPDGKTLYVLRAGAPEFGLPQDVIPINTATNTVGKPIETGMQPTAIAITTSHQQG
jgi:DNA-binding beta-propeller fold protein YncE